MRRGRATGDERRVKKKKKKGKRTYTRYEQDLRTPALLGIMLCDQIIRMRIRKDEPARRS